MKKATGQSFKEKPRLLFEDARIAELKEAIGQYLSSEMPIPTELVEEYNELVDKLPFDN